MTSRLTADAFLGHEFDTFLFAAIGKESNEMSLSVLSALARSDVDPWQEAATLRDLPKEIAVLRLASLLQKLPVDHLVEVDAQKIAHRLLALLPTPVGRPATTSAKSPQAGTTGNSQASALVFFVLYVLVSLSLLTLHKVPLRVENEPVALHEGRSRISPSPVRPMASSLESASK